MLLWHEWRRFCWRYYFYSPQGQESGGCAKLGHSIQTGGVQTPWTPPGSAPDAIDREQHVTTKAKPSTYDDNDDHDEDDDACRHITTTVSGTEWWQNRWISPLQQRRASSVWTQKWDSSQNSDTTPACIAEQITQRNKLISNYYSSIVDIRAVKVRRCGIF